MSTPQDASIQTVDGMCFQPPAHFELVETVLSLRAPAREELKDPRLVQGILNKRVSVQENVILHRRRAKANANVEDIAGESLAELIRSMVHMKKVTKAEFVFADEVEGILLAFDFSATSSDTLRQYHVFRLDGDMLTTLTLTVDSSTLTTEREEEYYKTLASLIPQS